MRNNIHMNLFASFILRALSILIKDALLEATNITSQDLSRDQEQGFPQASMPPVDLLVNNGVSTDPRAAQGSAAQRSLTDCGDIIRGLCDFCFCYGEGRLRKWLFIFNTLHLSSSLRLWD